uniref:RNA-dependent RNA polymerase n=1 Tax=Albugo laibachii Nc14 TaxID=890382 RepID=F0WV51_9STRA|nr:RNAdependent RNA Polymerase1 (RDR1) putative [Albugo laibachii Nc14]|eukprot:CCA25290.1 RNAdependent RNA Polymerase1 (RDR1) putative [Albugo laibachii Nc14]
MVHSSVLGIASNAHLARCDYSDKGSFDPDSMKLAWICSLQVDGHRAEEHLQVIRDLSPPIYPDFMESERFSHRSSKSLGTLYRSSKILTLLDHSCLKYDEQHVNDEFMVGNYTKYAALTKILYRQYSRSTAALMRMYGAVLEGELASGLIIKTDDLYRTDYFRFGERCRDAFFKNVRQYRKIFSVLCGTLNEFERCELASAWYYAVFSCKNGQNRFLSFGWIIMDELLMSFSINQAQTRTKLHSAPLQNMNNSVSKLQVSMMANLELGWNSFLSEYFDRLQARSAVECSISPMINAGIRIILFGSSALFLNEKVSDLDLMIWAPKGVDLHAVKHVLASTLYKETVLKDEMRVAIIKFVLERWEVEMCTQVNGPLKTHLFRAYILANAFFWPTLYFLLNWGRCSAFVKRGENLFSPTNFIWLFVGFCLHKNFMSRIPTQEIKLEDLLEEANDMNKQVSLWDMLLRDILVNSSTSSPTAAQVLWKFLTFYADSFTPACFYGCQDAYDAINNTQLDDRNIGIFRGHCQIALHQLMLNRGRVDCLLVKTTDHSTRIILSRG